MRKDNVTGTVNFKKVIFKKLPPKSKMCSVISVQLSPKKNLKMTNKTSMESTWTRKNEFEFNMYLNSFKKEFLTKHLKVISIF